VKHFSSGFISSSLWNKSKYLREGLAPAPKRDEPHVGESQKEISLISLYKIPTMLLLNSECPPHPSLQSWRESWFEGLSDSYENIQNVSIGVLFTYKLLNHICRKDA
jgi:hypothetical protein